MKKITKCLVLCCDSIYIDLIKDILKKNVENNEIELFISHVSKDTYDSLTEIPEIEQAKQENDACKMIVSREQEKELLQYHIKSLLDEKIKLEKEMDKISNYIKTL